MKCILFISSAFLLLPYMAQAQSSNPFKSIGKDAEMLTLSKGRYQETFDEDTLQRIGSVVINSRTHKIVQLLDADSLSNETSDNSSASRWYSVDPLAAKFASMSPYVFCANNPILYIDPDGREFVLPGDKKAQDAYVKMLHASTGNNYSIVDNKLTLVGADAGFKGNKSQTLINVIKKGMDSKDVYTLSLVGAGKDDKGVFIDSYSEGKIDVSDLKKLGNASTALQGAAIGHYLNEVQAVPGYSTADATKREGMFESAHNPSLGVEATVFGELVGDKTITTKTISSSGVNEGFEGVIYEYNSKNKFEIQQGATTIKKGTGQFLYQGGPEIMEGTIQRTGEINSVQKIK